MSNRACDLCGQPSGDDAYLCVSCSGRLAQALREVHGDARLHGLDVDLDIAIAKQGATGAGRRPRGAEQPLIIDPRASEARAVLHSTLATWCRAIHGDVGGTLPHDTLSGMARWLGAYTGWLRHTPYGPECADEIGAAVDQARRAVDTPTRRVPLHRQCPAVALDEGGRPTPCTGTLVGIIAPGLHSDGQVRCTTDPTHVTRATQWADRRRGAQLPAPG